MEEGVEGEESWKESRGHVIRENLISAPGEIMIISCGEVSRGLIHPCTTIHGIQRCV